MFVVAGRFTLARGVRSEATKVGERSIAQAEGFISTIEYPSPKVGEVIFITCSSYARIAT